MASLFPIETEENVRDSHGNNQNQRHPRISSQKSLYSHQDDLFLRVTRTSLNENCKANVVSLSTTPAQPSATLTKPQNVGESAVGPASLDLLPALDEGLGSLPFTFSTNTEEVERLQREVTRLRETLRETRADQSELEREFKDLLREHLDLKDKHSNVVAEKFNTPSARYLVPEATIRNQYIRFCNAATAWCDEACFELPSDVFGGRRVAQIASHIGLCECDEVLNAAEALHSIIKAMIIRSVFDQVLPKMIDQHIAASNLLWAPIDSRTTIDGVEKELRRRGIPHEEISLWSWLTTTAIAPEPFVAETAAEEAANETLLDVASFFRDTEWHVSDGLQRKLLLNVVAPAIELSRLMRICRSPVWLNYRSRTVTSEHDSNQEERLVVSDPIEFSLQAQTTSVTLYTEPELLIRRRDRGSKADDEVIVEGKEATIKIVTTPPVCHA